MKDSTKKFKHCIIVKLTDTDKKRTLNAVAELPPGSRLLTEFTKMIKDMDTQDEAARKPKKKSK